MLDIWKDYSGITEVIKQEQRKLIIEKENQTQAPLAEEFVTSSKAVFENYIKNQIDEQNKVNSVKQEAEEVFNQQQWAKASRLFKYLYENDPNDWAIMIKYGTAATLSGNTELVNQAEPIIRRAIAAVPSFTDCYGMLALNLMIQNRLEDSLQEIRKLIQCGPRSDEGNAVVDGIKLAAQVCAKLNKDFSEFDKEFLQVAKLKFPSKSHEIDLLQAHIIFESEKLTKEALEWIFNPVKEFETVKPLFARLCTLLPNEHWPPLILGVCYTLTGQLVQGEAFIRTSIQLNPNIPNGYAVLAQNLHAQHKNEEASNYVEQMLERRFDSVDMDADHASKIIEGLSVARKIHGNNSPKFLDLVAKSRAFYPALDEKITECAKQTDTQKCCMQ